MRRILIRIGINAVALWVASELVSGIELEEGLWKILAGCSEDECALDARQGRQRRTLWIVLVINAVMLLITDWLTRSLEVDGFGSAFWGAVIISVVSWALSVFIPDKTLFNE